MALELHIEPIPEQAHQRVGARLDQMRLCRHQGTVKHAVRASRQRDQTVRVPVEPPEFDMRRLGAGVIEVRPRIEVKQITIAGLGRGEQNKPRQRLPGAAESRRARLAVLVAAVDRQRTADDRLNAGCCHLVGEFQRPEHVVCVRERDRRLAVSLGKFRQPGDRQSTFQQRIGRMQVKMDEAERHGVCLSRESDAPEIRR